MNSEFNNDTGFEGLKRIRKSAYDRMLGGVCGGLGESTPIPAWIWRVIFLLSIIFGGLGAFVYIILWIFMPGPQR
ncbi:MAG TPA: PspC domain-containing protein [Victivallales bacterium]|nr:PspC domain-containing protein [Victivallales bacterium]